jgi:hypothetical protein
MRRATTTPLILPLLLLIGVFHASAQTSTSYKLSEHVFNAGGHPEQGTVLSSASYKVSLDSLGDGVLGDALGSGSFHLDGGLVAAYPPPGEVLGLHFASPTQIVWNAEKSVGTYDVYRGATASLPGTFGTCLANGLTLTSFPESAAPALGTAFFYIATAENLLGEEGTKGKQSNGAERPNPAPCP